ncbi:MULTISPECIES: hypothetical protein [Amycolatopsis]|uniref:TROVE domain-containing protein n=2 Tax=Amycolatopsis TaxID=1813 RepID=A0A1I3TZ61_9PSEU|nr:hypothetical protein [Amycolatopsis sacchari]SFJ75773.1 hypothetical protein SAMN05421835_108136 [Amycolatopsis sacchari]
MVSLHWSSRGPLNRCAGEGYFWRLAGEDAFYESARERDNRFTALVRETTLDDPEWTVRFLRWLRSEANFRTAALVGAAEFAHARLSVGAHVLSRSVVSSVLQRADEPGELLGYWFAAHGRAIPKPVKRGIADAVSVCTPSAPT